MEDKFFIEVDCQQANHLGERICGDVFRSKKVEEENRIILVLADGMGHGVKANVLATLTASMALNFSVEHKEPEKIAELILKTLPECSVRKMAYSTFTVVDMEYNGNTTILDFNNPETLILRDGRKYIPEWKSIQLAENMTNSREIKVGHFKAQKGDRIVFCSDGVTQSGLGSPSYPFGWGEEGMTSFLLNTIKSIPDISANLLATKLINISHNNDKYENKDDISVASVYFRQARHLLICTGPPFEESKDIRLGEIVSQFKGKRIIMGATTSDIISRELNIKIENSNEIEDPELSPMSYMEGIDLVTEGILTLSKVERLLLKYVPGMKWNNGPADRVIKLIMESDDINIIVGTKINIAHQDPSLPVELEIRRTVVKRIELILRQKFLKKIEISYL